MALTSGVTAAASIAALYRTALRQTGESLVAVVQSQARLAEAVARHDAIYEQHYPGGPEAATIAQLRDAREVFPGFGETGEFTVGRLAGDSVELIFERGRGGVTVPDSLPLDSPMAVSMRRALEGRSGTLVGPDFKGNIVLAAYEPVAALGLGMVAKIDLDEVRAPYVRAGTVAAGLTLAVVLLGLALFFRVGGPVLDQLERHASRLEELLEDQRRREAERVELEKMVAIGRMMAGIAHELNNPLGAIVNYAHFCRAVTDPGDERHGPLESIEQEAHRCGRLVGDLLLFARGAGHVKPALADLALGEVVERGREVLAGRVAEVGAELRAELPADLPPVRGEPDLLLQVVLNLLANALDAVEGRPERRVELLVRAEDRLVVLSVSDTGPGVAEDDRGRIFDPFFSTKPAGKGTGLGLSIARGIVEAHGGAISLEDRPGGGTTFVVDLPAGGGSGERA